MGKYYHYFNGPYGVIDVFRKNILINLQDETIAHAVRETFASKVGLVVYDLRCFENYREDPPLVDSDCCLDWQIGIESNPLINRMYLASAELIRTQRKHSSSVLINTPLQTLLSPARIKELQEQMCLYVCLLQQTELHLVLDTETIKNNYIQLRFDPVINYDKIFSALYREINTIFSRDLHISTIETSLQDLANVHVAGEYPDLAFKILQLIGKIYE
jgi:hypothetical protein